MVQWGQKGREYPGFGAGSVKVSEKGYFRDESCKMSRILLKNEMFFGGSRNSNKGIISRDDLRLLIS